MEEDKPQKTKRADLFQLIFVRNIGKRQERTVLANQMTHEVAQQLRDAYAEIGARKIESLREELRKAELEADNKAIQQKNAAIAQVIGKSETTTFSITLDQESNAAFLKPKLPDFPREEAARSEAAEPAKAKRGKTAESEAAE